MPFDPEIFGSGQSQTRDADIFKDLPAPKAEEESAPVEKPKSNFLGLKEPNAETRALIERAKSQGWGTGYPKLANRAGQSVMDAGLQAGLPGWLAATGGTVTDVAMQALPMFLTSFSTNPSSLLRWPSAKLMQSAVKPSSTLPAKDVKNALGTMLDEGIYPTQAGMEKASKITRALDDTVEQAIAGSQANVSVPAVTSRLNPLLEKATKQVNPNADMAAVENAWTEFLKSPSIAGNREIPVQLAHELKKGTYQALGGKSYGEVGSVATEAQKQLARGLREEVANAVPSVVDPLKRQASLMNVKDVAGTRALIEANKNPMGLAALRMDSPLSQVAFMADRWAALKAFLAFQANSLGKPNVLAPAGIQAGMLMQRPEEQGALYQYFTQQ